MELPTKKEPHFFDCEELDWAGDSSQRNNIYHSFFEEHQGKTRGESTPVYLYWEPCAERIWNYNSEMRLIAILRNPITRAYSHWNMEVLRGRETLNFLEALHKEPERQRTAAPRQDRIFSYVDRGYYSKQLQRIWAWFDPSSTLVLRQEELLRDPAACLRRVYAHLGVPAVAFGQALTRHALPYSSPMPEAARDWLRTRFTEEIEALETLLGWDCADWLKSN